MSMKEARLRNDVFLPVIGAGLWKITDRQLMVEVVKNAWQCGYRLFDTASAYSNELALGKAVSELGLPREQIIIQDKLWTTCYGYENAQAACRHSLKKLKTDYLDVYLMHWPAPSKLYDNWEEINAETWRGMEQLYKEGYVRAIGVCNFKISHLEALGKTAAVHPLINQIEGHPGMPNKEITEYCRKKEIRIQASSPLGNGQILNNAELLRIAAESGFTAAQLCLKWSLEHGYIILPKTTSPERMRENFCSWQLNLDKDIMHLLDNLPFCGGLAIDSDEVNKFDEL